ncbi:MAG: DUF5050 domain-containing protein [Oscillospiraceae bacterium]|nr:DUF5050 domain-containing protein [Oscillospiraceae bacterium]
MARRKLLLLPVCIFLLISSFACSGIGDPEDILYVPTPSPGDNTHIQTPSGNDPSPPTDDISSPGSFSPTWESLDANNMPYQYANMFYSVSGAEILDTPETILFVFISSGRSTLMEYIKSTGRVEPYCKLATCSHLTDDCPAGMAHGGMDYRDGRLSMLRDRENAAGNARPWLSELKGDYFEFVTGQVNGAMIGPDAYYAITPDSSLARIAFESDKIDIIIDDFEYIKPIIIGNYLYAATLSDIIRIDLADGNYETEVIVSDSVATYTTDGRHLYYPAVDDDGPAVYRTNLDGGNPELVMRELVYAPYMSFDDSYIYFAMFSREKPNEPTNGNIYRLRLDLSGEKELLAETGAKNYQNVYTLPTSPDTLLILYRSMVGTEYFFLSKDGGELVKFWGD